jgi:hypothetical protein
MPIRDANAPVVRVCRGLRRLQPILSDSEGRPWRAPDAVIMAVKEVEARGNFDDAPGDKVKLTTSVLTGIQAVLTSTQASGRVEVLLPLLGGVKASVSQVGIARL